MVDLNPTLNKLIIVIIVFYFRHNKRKNLITGFNIKSLIVNNKEGMNWSNF